MAGINSLIEFLESNDDWSFKDIQSFLERDCSSINEKDDTQRTPIFYVLVSTKCSKEIVRLLLDYGASIDSRDKYGITPLLWALIHSRHETVVTELIEKGANINVQGNYGSSFLCLVFYNRLSKGFTENLLTAGCSFKSCNEHESLWRCFTESSLQELEPGYFEYFANLIIQAGAAVNKLYNDGRSPLCRVIFQGAGEREIKLLLSKGASFNDCRKHSSPMLCATQGYSEAILKADMIKLLLNEGASVEEVNEENYTPLQLALRSGRYETAAIRILLDLAGKNNNLANIRHETCGNLLHFAVFNSDCMPKIAKFLIKQGVRCDEANVWDRTPLHEVAKEDIRDLRIMEILVNNGSPVNAKCENGYTPLSLAVEDEMECNVLCLLLEAGAFIDGLTDRHGVSLLEQTLKQECGIDHSKILLKWLLIENPSFNIKSLTESYPGNEELITFADECVFDLQRMESVNVAHDLTLSGFIRGYSSQNGSNCERKLNIDLDQLLRAISMNQFLNYSDVISSKFNKLLLMEKLQQLSVYTLNMALTQVVCDYDCLWKITKYLTRKDLLCIILAFYFTRDSSRDV